MPYLLSAEVSWFWLLAFPLHWCHIHLFQFIITKKTHFTYIMISSCLLILWVWSGWILIPTLRNHQVNHKGYCNCPIKVFVLEKYVNVMLLLSSFLHWNWNKLKMLRGENWKSFFFHLVISYLSDAGITSVATKTLA